MLPILVLCVMLNALFFFPPMRLVCLDVGVLEWITAEFPFECVMQPGSTLLGYLFLPVTLLSLVVTICRMWYTPGFELRFDILDESVSERDDYRSDVDKVIGSEHLARAFRYRITRRPVLIGRHPWRLERTVCPMEWTDYPLLWFHSSSSDHVGDHELFAQCSIQQATSAVLDEKDLHLLIATAVGRSKTILIDRFADAALRIKDGTIIYLLHHTMFKRETLEGLFSLKGTTPAISWPMDIGMAK